MSLVQQPIDSTGQFQLFASVSYDTMLPQDNSCYTDEIIMFDSHDSWPRVFMPRSAFSALLPDYNGDGLHDYLLGVDALSILPVDKQKQHNYLNFVFSTNSNCLGFLDGDLISFNNQGQLQLVLSEGVLHTDLGIESGSLDIDAATLVEGNKWMLSFRDSLLSRHLGTILDGDVICYNPDNHSVEIFATEADVQQWVENAISGSAPIGDLKSLSYNYATQSILFTVQSPSNIDSTIFSNQNGGSIFKGLSEDLWQFRIPTEIDALCLASTITKQAPILSVSVPYVSSGDLINLRLRHVPVWHSITGFSSSAASLRLWPHASVGFAMPSSEGAFSGEWPRQGEAKLLSDGGGVASYSMQVPTLPVGAVTANIYCQARVEGYGLSSPIKIQISN